MKYTDSEIAQENWKDIFGYDGMYQVSDLGRVRSRKSGEWKVLRPGKDKGGYLIVGLCKDGKQKSFFVHRLVAQAFIENDNIFNTEINHIDECKQNNKVSNLEYCDRQYNMTYNDIHHRRIAKRDNYIRPKIEKVYNPDLSIKQNIEIFKSNGFECCIQTILRLRKDLGLIGSNSQPVRSKIKDLYDPKLSIKQNLEIFKANGIDCSRYTVIRLRKDLGLTKKYKV